jgi:hypothetical protein
VLYFGNPSTQQSREAMNAGSLGCIITPAQGNVLPLNVRWCADNGCFGKGYPGDDKWINWLAKFRSHADRCVFAVAPDVVGDAVATLARSAPWLPQIRELGFPAALVAQDGLEDLDVPWDSFDVLFIGGSTDWKLSDAARVIITEAKRRGKWVHMGRVNTGRRYNYARAIGCDSADGTTIAQFPRTLRDVLGWHARAERSPMMFGDHQ